MSKVEQIATILGNARSAGGMTDEQIAANIVAELKLVDDAPKHAEPAHNTKADNKK
jgi:hypothetical protein